jgi:glutamate-1-semialdehyde 2,1-aminomutase
MKSEHLFNEAKELMPGGVSSPVRAIKPYPFYTKSAHGSRITTVDAVSLIDCCMGYGPLILGHAHPAIRQEIASQLMEGWLYGTPTPLEPELAGMITNDHPGLDMVRFVSTGTEATMAAIRVARGFSGKKDIVKAEGGYHGAHDAVLVKAGSGATTLGIPDSAGVLPDTAGHTWQVPYNDPEALELLLSTRHDIAAFIVEPVMGNIGLIPPGLGYLKEVRKITSEHGVLLIFDEVITGYRLGIGGAQAYYGVRPDMTTLGKIVGGGVPIGVFGGRRDIMETVSPSGPVYQAGTFNGNPLSLAAGRATIRWLHEHPETYVELAEAARMLGELIKPSANGSFVRLGSMFTHFFRKTPPRDYREAKECDTGRFGAFFAGMLSRGIFLPPSQFETDFLSTAHTLEEIEEIGAAFNSCL